MRPGPYSRFWIGVTAVLSIVVIACGFPAFHRKSGFPASLLWTFAVVLGVWATYLIRAYIFSDRLSGNRSKENRSRVPTPSMRPWQPALQESWPYACEGGRENKSEVPSASTGSQRGYGTGDVGAVLEPTGRRSPGDRSLHSAKASTCLRRITRNSEPYWLYQQKRSEGVRLDCHRPRVVGPPVWLTWQIAARCRMERFTGGYSHGKNAGRNDGGIRSWIAAKRRRGTQNFLSRRAHRV